jgi:hypothetical protein
MLSGMMLCPRGQGPIPTCAGRSAANPQAGAMGQQQLLSES